MRKQTDLGLLILRGAGLLLALTFGVQKIGWYWSPLHAGKSFSSIGLAPLGMAGALYTSVRLGEDWLRAALYLIIFVTLIFTGPGKFSLDHLLKRKKSPAGC
jgi:uncharacterized membrane protein YphA (DoxX/SURF4 family)